MSILSIEEDKFEVNAVGGDTHLGGEDITSPLVADHCAEKLRQEHKDKGMTMSKKAICR